MPLLILPQAAQDEATCMHYAQCLTSWCKETTKVLRPGNLDEENGPDTELEYWRTRMATLNHITEQLKTNECKWVLGVCSAAKNPTVATWKELDIRVTEANNEAKDNVKFLSTLEQTLETMYQSNMDAIVEVMPVFMSNVKLIYEIARFYNTPTNMTRLLYKVTNQIIRKSKAEIMAPGKIWDQDRPQLLVNLRAAVRLADTYRCAASCLGLATCLLENLHQNERRVLKCRVCIQCDARIELGITCGNVHGLTACS